MELERRAALATGPAAVGLQRLPQRRPVGVDLLPGASGRRYRISLRTGSRSHSLIVFLDRLVRRAISLIDKPSRSRIRRTSAYIAMVCTSFPFKNLMPCREGRDTLVNFR